MFSTEVDLHRRIKEPWISLEFGGLKRWMSGLSVVFDARKAELRRFLVARTGSEADADDLVQELWLKCAATPSGPIDNPEGYLFKMANNLVLDRLRETKRRDARERDWDTERFEGNTSALERADPTPSAEQALAASGEVERLRAAIDLLPEGARRVLRMHKLEELSHAEVAERLGISRSAVEKHMAVAMNHLRRLLEN